MKTISLKPELTQLYTLNKFILEEITNPNFSVDLIIEEIFVNIVNYSTADYITVNADYEKPLLSVEFIDNGIEFNPLLNKDPFISDNIEDAKIGGLGIYLTKKLAVELDYHYINGENHLKIIINVEE